MPVHGPLYEIHMSGRDIDCGQRAAEEVIFYRVYDAKITVGFNEYCQFNQYCKDKPEAGFISQRDTPFCPYCPAWIQAINHLQDYAKECSGDGHDCKECYFGFNVVAIKLKLCRYYPSRMNAFYHNERRKCKGTQPHSACNGSSPRNRDRDNYFRKMHREEINEQRRRAQFQF